MWAHETVKSGSDFTFIHANKQKVDKKSDIYLQNWFQWRKDAQKWLPGNRN